MGNADASALLSINLQALQENYRFLQSKSSADVAGVIKANGYGIGAVPAMQALQEAGCKSFFVATLLEGLELRKQSADAKIFILNGLFTGAEASYVAYRLIPVLGSLEEMSRWAVLGDKKPCALQFDTGMNRRGIRAEDVSGAVHKARELNVALVMSHFISSEEPDNPLNIKQFEKFSAIAKQFPNTPKSLCNSSGVFLSPDYHFDMLRPGICLYGANPTPHEPNPMKAVVDLKTRILQTHTAKAGESAGYNATYSFTKDTPVVTVSLGYADGFLRSGSNKAKLYYEGQACPIVGRISMDLSVIDVSACPSPPKIGGWMEVLGPHQSVDAMAADMGTISYEVLTGFGHRYTRIYPV